MYAVTRAEDYPELAAAEPWEPGIPGVTVNLYASDGTTLLDTTTTDSWDATPPTDCKYGNDATGPFVFRGEETDCYDGMRVGASHATARSGAIFSLSARGEHPCT